MSHQPPFPIRVPCPPGACTCQRDSLLEDPNADIRVLRLTREEEKHLLARIESLSNYPDLLRIQQLLQSQVGVELTLAPSARGVRTVRGISIQVAERPGLCRKLRQSIPAAIRRCLVARPEIAHALLDAHDLLGSASDPIDITTD